MEFQLLILGFSLCEIFLIVHFSPTLVSADANDDANTLIFANVVSTREKMSLIKNQFLFLCSIYLKIYSFD